MRVISLHKSHPWVLIEHAGERIFVTARPDPTHGPRAVKLIADAPLAWRFEPQNNRNEDVYDWPAKEPE